MTHSTGRDDLLGADSVGPVDRSLADQPTRLVDGVGGSPGAAGSGSLGDLPLDLDGVTGARSGAGLDGSGHDPGEHELVRSTGFADDGRPGVLDADRVDAVDDVRTGKPIADLDLRAGESARSDGEQERSGSDEGTRHGVGESIEVTLPVWAKRTLATLAVILVAVLSFAVFEPIQVLPRIRLAPGFAMTTQSGASFTSEDARGSVTLYTFTHGDCGEECAATNATMAEIADRARGEIDLSAIDLNLVTVSFDEEADRSRLDQLAAESGADGELWQWAALESDAVPTVIGAGFRVWVDPLEDGGFEFDQTLVLVDGWGVIRGEYQYATLASDADRIIRHIGVLEEEIRNSHGVASFAYEAAHVFLCYP